MAVPEGKPTLAPPLRLRERYVEWEWTVAWQYGTPAITYRLGGPRDEVHFLKLGSVHAYPCLADEADRMRWAAAHLPVPRVLEQGTEGDTAWLLTKGLAGADATDARWRAEPERLVVTLARGLRRVHEMPVAACPFDFRLDRALAHARRRVERGLVDPDHDFHEEFSGLSAATALSILERSRPAEKSLVVCHGDYCPPNVMVTDWQATGFLDLGELGTADRWWDLAVGAWSVGWNLGVEYEALFFSAYGVERDEERVRYYRLLYDVVS